jgi:uncharacterized RDD family membrane protein YckC/tetratricopeptide (TPR) repeat protein
MVLDDVFAKPKASPASAPSEPVKLLQWGMAQPLDRLASIIADMVLFVPIASLATAILRKHLLQAQITGNQDQYTWMLAGCTVVCIFLFIAYQSLCHAHWSATLGQNFLGLKVVSVWSEGQRPSRKNAVIRALVLLFEICLFGLPLLAVFANERRRSWHDRMADTIVLSHRSIAKNPSINEVSIAAGFQTAVLVFVAFMSIVSWQSWYRASSSGGKIAQELESENILCSEVGDALEDWPKASGESSKVSRLQVGLALFSAGAVSEDCLEAEADFAIWHSVDENKGLAYLSKALVHENETHLFYSYTEKVCGSDANSKSSELCRTLHLATDDGASNAQTVSADNQLMSWTPKEDFSRLWLAKHWLKTHRYDRVLSLLETWEPRKDLGFFVTSLRAQALWQTGQVEQAHLIMTTSLDHFAQNQRIELARWFCAADSVDGCASQAASSCRSLLDAVEKNPSTEVSSPEVAEVLVRGEECVHGDKANWSALKENIKVAEGLSYIHAVELLQVGQKAQAKHELQSLLETVEDENPFYYSAQAKLAELSPKPEELSEIKTSWLQGGGEIDESWAVLGHRLFEHYSSEQNVAAALQVGELLQSIEPFNMPLAKSLVVIAFHSGQIKEAQRLLSHALFVPETHAGRVPAAVNDFDEVATRLQDALMHEHEQVEKLNGIKPTGLEP